MEINKIYNMDCIKGMQQLEDQSVDMILCDLPYGVTACEWDVIIPFDVLWEQYKRIIKPGGNIVLFGSQPFTSKLVCSNINWFSHSWVWEKQNGTNFLNVKKQPFKIHEDIVVFRSPCRQSPDDFTELRTYMHSELLKSGKTRKDINNLLGNQMSSHYFTNGIQFTIPTRNSWEKLQSTGYFQRPYEEIERLYKENMRKTVCKYYPQMSKGRPYRSKGFNDSEVYHFKSKGIEKVNIGTRYPVSILKYDYDKERFHPTQKPAGLCEYLIKTYSNEGELVLDNCMGAGTTAVACINTKRNYIGFEKEEKYFKMGQKRCSEVYENC